MLTQERLATLSGVSVRTIRNLEGGRIARPHPDSVRSLADALGMAGRERDALAAAVRPDAPPAAPIVVPRQLPAPPRWFAGRAGEFAELDDALLTSAADAVLVAAIGGAGGVGKAALALRWAHRNADRFPDGQLFLDLRGFDPASAPLSPAPALRALLEALGVDQGSTPADQDSQAGLYRSLLAGRRMLIVLDNARDSDQVTPLLPGSPTCAVLVTSRQHLSALVATHGARPVRLDALGPAESAELLRDRLGAARCDSEPDAVTELLLRCAGLPLALHIVAARAAVRTLPLTAMARELDEASSGLDALDAGEIGVNLRAVFAASYRVLDADAAGLFDLLGLVPGPDIGLAAIAAMLDRPVADARRLVRELDNAHLINQQGDDRYGMHDLVRRYAAERAGRDPAPGALSRLVEYYGRVARLANSRQQNVPIDDEPAGDFDIPPLADAADALAWFDAEQANLLATLRLAVGRDWAEHASRLAAALDGYFYWRGRTAEHLSVCRLGLTMAERLDDPVRLAIALRGLGIASGRAGLLDESLGQLRRAAELAERSGDLRTQARVHRSLGWVYGRLGSWRRRCGTANSRYGCTRPSGTWWRWPARSTRRAGTPPNSASSAGHASGASRRWS